MTEQQTAPSSTAILTPEWVKDAVFYQIFPDSFARSERVAKPGGVQPWGSLPTPHGYKGGDLLGVVEHLDVLADLGINAIYFCPVFQSASNHRYHTHDYYQVDPMLGGNAALRELLDEAHKRGIRIVLDGVFNHASRGFFQFSDILENGLKSAYVDWFVIKDRNKPLNAYNDGTVTEECQWDPNYRCWWDLPALPEFNTDNAEVREFLLDVAEHWIEFGIDGWRLDVPEDIDDEPFWQAFRRRVKAINPEAYIVGEIWHPAQDWLRGDRFDAVMNYVFNRTAQSFFGGDRLDTSVHPGGYDLEPIKAGEFGRRIEEMLALYDWQVTQVQLNLLGSHDTPRILSILGEDKARLKMAVLFQMTMPGAPCIYYGDEVGMLSVPSPGHEGRATMSWDKASWDGDLRDAVKRAIALRHAYPALRRGKFVPVHADDEHNVYAFVRHLGEETIVVVFNNGDAPYPLDVPVGEWLADGMLLSDCLGQGKCAVSGGRAGGLTMSPRSSVVLLKV
ncbi:MAG: glycoside hydrolase family 13 protein [Anaerolineae bacterium]|nr:glycoside hydrolase family 13 protein [Anaerolineae bacterium]